MLNIKTAHFRLSPMAQKCCLLIKAPCCQRSWDLLVGEAASLLWTLNQVDGCDTWHYTIKETSLYFCF